MKKKTAAQLDAEIAEALRKDPSEVVGALRAVYAAHGLKEVPCKRCKGAGYIYTTRQEACPACNKHGKVMGHAKKKAGGKVMGHAKKKAGMYVGAELRDALIEEFNAIGWEGADTDGEPYAKRAEKVKAALQHAVPDRKGFLINVADWVWQDYDFLRDNLSDVAEDMGHAASSRGIRLGGTVIGRQIRALREKL